MPLPTISDVHVNRPLTNVAVAFTQDPANFISRRVFPEVLVDKQTDLYFTWAREDFFRDTAAEVGPTGEAPIDGLRLSTDSYACKVWKLAHLIADQERDNADAPLNLDVVKTEDIMRKLLIRLERLWAQNFFTTGLWTGSTTGTDLVGGADFVTWDNYAASDPVQTIRQQVFYMIRNTGGSFAMQDIKLTLGADVYQKLVDHPRFIERYEHVMPSIMTPDLMAAVLGIGEVVVPMSAYNTAAEGHPATMAFIHGKNALLTYSPQAAAINRPSAGYTFMWRGISPAGPISVRRWRVDSRESDQIEGKMAPGQKVVSAPCGVFFSGAVS